MKSLRHSLPHTINETPDAIKNNIYTHSLHDYNLYKNMFAKQLQWYMYSIKLLYMSTKLINTIYVNVH